MLHPYPRLASAAALGPCLIFFALARGGADGFAPAALFAAALLCVLLFALATAPREAVAAIARGNLIAAFGAAGFVAWCLLSAAPLPATLAPFLAHPLGAGVAWRTPSIALAPTDALLGLPAMLAGSAAFALGALAGAHRGVRGLCLTLLSGLALILALAALVDFTAQSRVRLEAGLPSANIAAGLFAALSLLAAAIALRATRRSKRSTFLPRELGWAQAMISAPLSTLAALLTLACALLTASRGGAAALLVGAIVFLVALAAAGRQRREQSSGQLATIFGALGLLALAAAAGGAGGLLDRFQGDANSFEGRQQLIEAHWAAFLERPWLGHGLGAYDQLNAMQVNLENKGALLSAGAVHNIYVQALEETGIIGFVLLCLAVAPLLWQIMRSAIGGGRNSEIAAGALAVSTVLLGQAAVDFTLQTPALAALFGFTLGIARPPLTST